MKQIVIMPGGFHPFHAGHADLYQQAKKAFPGADIYVAATNDQSERPFPFSVKEKLAKVAGVEPGHFIQVKSPFQAKEITQNYNPDEDVLIFVRSEKDRNESPKPGGMKKDGTPAYFQPWTGKNVQPFSKHAYITYLKTVKFGPGITSATEIRNAWPTLNDKRKTAMVMSLYPATQKNPKLAANIVGMLDQVMGGQENVAEGYSNTTFNVDRRKLNVSALIQKGAILVTHPHGEQGWETDNKEDWAFSLLSLYNVLQGGWASEAKKYLKPQSYKRAEQQINSSAPNLGSDKLVYDGKYNQILWSIKKLGIPDNVAFLDKDKQGVAEGSSEIKIPTEDGITMQDIRLMAGEGPLTKKTILQAIAVIRKQRRPQDVAEDKESDPVTSAVLSFYKPVVNDIHKEKLPDYVDQARELLHQTNDPEVRSKLIDIFKKGKENPYIQGGIVTTVGALLAGGILTTAQRMGLSPAQTNLALQAILNTVIPTVVSRINGKNWSDTIKYTLASAGIGTGIAGAGLLEDSSLSVEELAQISDKALDDAYHYGRSTPGANFGWMANLQSAKAAKRLIDAGETDIEKISDAIHQGWNVTAAADYKGQLQLDTPTPDEKKLKRAKLAMQSYAQLPEEEKEKDRVVARALLSALGGKVDEGFGIPLPGTYEQEHDMDQKQSGHHTRNLTTETNMSESMDYIEEK
jgi:glycerol-3-phosphate cytidylyltransferase-like family protein